MCFFCCPKETNETWNIKLLFVKFHNDWGKRKYLYLIIYRPLLIFIILKWQWTVPVKPPNCKVTESGTCQITSWTWKNHLKGKSVVIHWFIAELHPKLWAHFNVAQVDIWSTAGCISAALLSSPHSKTLCKCHSVNTEQGVCGTLSHFSQRLSSPTRRHPPPCHPAGRDNEWD